MSRMGLESVSLLQFRVKGDSLLHIEVRRGRVFNSKEVDIAIVRSSGTLHKFFGVHNTQIEGTNNSGVVSKEIFLASAIFAGVHKGEIP